MSHGSHRSGPLAGASALRAQNAWATVRAMAPAHSSARQLLTTYSGCRICRITLTAAPQPPLDHEARRRGVIAKSEPWKARSQ